MAWKITVTDHSIESADALVSHHTVATEADVPRFVESLVASPRFAQSEREWAVEYADAQLEWYPNEPFFLDTYTRLGERVTFVVSPDN